MVDRDELLQENEYLAQRVELQTQEVQRHIDRMTALNLVASTVSQSLELDKTLTTALEIVTRVCGAEAGGISLIDTETNEVVLWEQLGWENDFVSHPMRIPAGEGMSGVVIHRDAVLVVPDLNGHHDFAVPRFREEPFQSIAMAPMHARGKIIGILSIMSKHLNAFDTPTVDILRTVADTVGVALDNARLYKQSVENQTRLNAVLQSSADGIIATDLSGTIRMMNQSAEKMLSTAVTEALNRPLRDVPIPKELSEPLRVALSSRDESPEKSFEIQTQDERHLLVFVSPVFEGDTTLTEDNHDGWVIVLQDVTHFRNAAKTKAEFIQAAAHDMRNPLGVTMSSIGTLQQITEDELALEALDIALSGVTRIENLLNDLLHLERIEGGYQFSMDDVDITELLYEITRHMHPLLDEKDQNCEIDIQGSLGTVWADAHWINRAITNYAVNAVKYTPEGGTITIRAFKTDNVLHIEVTDDGPGIPLAVQSRLFERFYRVKEASRQPGSGLGLAIVKSVVEAHGGGVYMRSKLDEGSTFGMVLPVKAG